MTNVGTANAGVDVELLQFRCSNAAEKARWALDHKGIAHRRRSLLPGLHRGAVANLTAQTATPVLRIGEESIAGSAPIIEALEQRFPETPLLPSDPELRAQAIEHARHLDAKLGPAVRIAVLDAIGDDADYTARLYTPSDRPAMRAFYRAWLPFVRARMRRASGMRDKYSTRLAEQHLDTSAVSLARFARRSFHLCGEHFSVADLTAASLFAPLVSPPHPDVSFPEPMPASLAALIAKWRAHPAGEWVLEMYRRYRPVRPIGRS